MGLFQKKDKEKNRPRPEELLAPSQPQPPPTSTKNSYNDSTYHSMSDVSNTNPQQISRPASQAPGTTVTTTTTTTTTTTVVTSDGKTYSQTQPYNPATDPPPEVSETKINTPLPGNERIEAANGNQEGLSTGTAVAIDPPPAQQQRPDFHRMQSPARKPSPLQTQMNSNPNNDGRPQSDIPFGTPTSPSTTGGRTIPTRSELHDSTPPTNHPQLFDPTTAGPASPYGGLPPRSEKRKSREYMVHPLNISHQNSGNKVWGQFPGPVSYPAQDNLSTAMPNESNLPTKSLGLAPYPAQDNVSTAMPNESNLPTEHSGQYPHEFPSSAQQAVRPEPQVQQPHVSKRQSFSTALRGLHGAGEALRGSVNSKVAHASHNVEEEERMCAVREQGMQDFKGSGLYDKTGVWREKVEGGRKLRKRSLSRGPQLGHSLDVVDERPTP